MTLATDLADLPKPGHIPRGNEWERLVDQVIGLSDMGWSTWTPSWTSDGTQPALGNGTITGRVRKYDEVDKVDATILLTMGSTTTYGTLAWHFNLPVAMSTASKTDAVAWGAAYDASSTAIYAINGRIESNVWRMGSGGGSVVLSTVPMTWATSDILILNFSYEPA